MEKIPEQDGTSGLQMIWTIAAMGTEVWPQILLLHFILPAVLSYLIAIPLRRAGWIKDGDLRLEL